MKITESQLRRLIKEETLAVLNEGNDEIKRPLSLSAQFAKDLAMLVSNFLYAPTGDPDFCMKMLDEESFQIRQRIEDFRTNAYPGTRDDPND